MAEPKRNLHQSRRSHELVAETESGARNPTGAIPKKILFYVPLIWTLFQLWYASPLPFIFNIFVFNDTEARAIHLPLPCFCPTRPIPLQIVTAQLHPVQDWVMALVAAFCASYLFWFYAELSDRPARPTMDLIVAVVGLIMLLEATRRALGRR
jgi:TRAP-type uncharacterized transport system fused permease subunit